MHCTTKHCTVVRTLHGSSKVATDPEAPCVHIGTDGVLDITQTGVVVVVRNCVVTYQLMCKQRLGALRATPDGHGGPHYLPSIMQNARLGRVVASRRKGTPFVSVTVRSPKSTESCSPQPLPLKPSKLSPEQVARNVASSVKNVGAASPRATPSARAREARVNSLSKRRVQTGQQRRHGVHTLRGGNTHSWCKLATSQTSGAQKMMRVWYGRIRQSCTPFPGYGKQKMEIRTGLCVRIGVCTLCGISQQSPRDRLF